METLKSTINTKQIEKQIMRHARQKFPRRERYLSFEHGHWWLTVEDTEGARTFDVTDCQGLDGVDYFDFEEV